MKFQWDQGKSDACFRDRGFDFAYAVSAFGDPNRVVRQDTRIISARKANQREVRRYEDRSHDD